MQDIDEERYVSLRMAHADLEYACTLLKSAAGIQDTTTKAALFYFAIICFFRPFKTSRGIFKKRFHALDQNHVCMNHLDLFNKLGMERDERIAHKDISAYSPELHYWSAHDIFPIVFKSSQIRWEDAGLWDEFNTMLSDALMIVEGDIKAMENEFRKNMPNQCMQADAGCRPRG